MSSSTILKYLNAMADHEASDLYLTVGFPPTLRVEDDLIKITGYILTEEDINGIVSSVLTSRQRRDYETNWELNTSLDMGGHGRFRLNIMRQRQVPALVIRRIVSEIPSFDDLNLPKILESLSMEKRGLILVTGMTGSGKTTSLAAMIDHRNSNSVGHIITVEDPIEFFHDHKGCVVSQREVGVDTESYAIAMKNSLRQRPDVILVGEVRDREVMEQALSIAETGHLCLATIHTNNSYQAIERIVNLFPEDTHAQIRMNLSMNLKGIISQRLIPSIDGNLVPVIEVLINQGLVRELILKGDIGKIHDVMEQNNMIGMRSFDQSLIKLFVEGVISEDVAISNSDKPSDMKIKVHHEKLTASSSATQGAFGGIDISKMSFKD